MADLRLKRRKLIRVGSSYAVIVPKDMVENTDFFQTKEFSVVFEFTDKNEQPETEQERLLRYSTPQSHICMGEA